jgi:hypothetical protein
MQQCRLTGLKFGREIGLRSDTGDERMTRGENSFDAATGEDVVVLAPRFRFRMSVAAAGQIQLQSLTSVRIRSETFFHD